MQKRTGLAIVIALVAVAAIIGAFFVGNNTGRQDAAAENQKERELDTLLNRSDLESLGDIDGKINVTGHQSPDSDTVCGAIAYAALLQELGYDAQPVVLGKINNESKYILEAAGVETPEELIDASGENMVLVDHGEYSQSAEGLEDANVLAIIDHHGDGTVMTSGQLIYDARPLGSACTIIWIRYRNYDVEIDGKTALLLMGGVLSDTKNLQSENTTSADRAAVEELARLAGVADVDAFYRDMFKAAISYEGYTDEEILFSDYKEYEGGGKIFSIACVEAYDEEAAQDLAKRMKAALPSTYASTGVDLAFVQVSIFHDNLSMVYLVPAGDVEKDVLEEAFGAEATFDGTSFVLEPGISRRQVTAPAITDVLAAHPSE